MVALSEREKQVLETISALPADRRRLILYELARASQEAWQRNTQYAEQQLRRRAAARGLDWDQLDDEQRQQFVCDLVREGD